MDIDESTYRLSILMWDKIEVGNERINEKIQRIDLFGGDVMGLW